MLIAFHPVASTLTSRAQWAMIALGILAILLFTISRAMRRSKAKRSPLEREPARPAQQQAAEPDTREAEEKTPALKGPVADDSAANPAPPDGAAVVPEQPTTGVEQAFQMALQHHQAGRLPQAEQLYRRILDQQPSHADSLHFLGVIAGQAGHHDAAVDLIGRAIALKPDWPDACTNLGNALQAKGKPDEAIAAYRRAIALKSDSPNAHNNLGNALKAKGELDESIAAYRQAIALKPDYPNAYNNLGNAPMPGENLTSRSPPIAGPSRSNRTFAKPTAIWFTRSISIPAMMLDSSPMNFVAGSAGTPNR